jgi:hypothetical protein
MSVGSVFLVLAFLLFLCLGAGFLVFPRGEMFAFGLLTLGLLLGGVRFPPWP